MQAECIPTCGKWTVEASEADQLWTVGRYWNVPSEATITLDDGQHWEPRDDFETLEEAQALADELNGE